MREKFNSKFERFALSEKENVPKKINFILKLAEASNVSDQIAVQSILEQLKTFRNNRNFPNILNLLDPDQYHSKTKLLSKEGKKRLKLAIEKLINPMPSIKEKTNLIRKELEIPPQEIKKEDSVLPEKEIKGIEEKDYEKFKIKNGETDIGVYWYEYKNITAKKLKESGKLKWGKERIYFDISLDDMEKLRDLTFDVAKSKKIPIAFKYLDVQKTNKIDLRQDSETTRFVANFASVKDAKRFYQALQQRKEYRQMKSDRNLDYHGFDIDNVAHYASGYRENREPLKRIIETAQKNPDSTYSYYTADGLRKMTISKELYNNFVDQYKAMSNPKEIWEKTNI